MLECVRWIVKGLEATRHGDGGVMDTERAESGTLGDWVCRLRRREVLKCVRWIVEDLEATRHGDWRQWSRDTERAESGLGDWIWVFGSVVCKEEK